MIIELSIFDLTSKFNAFKMLPVRLHKVIGKTHTADSCNNKPENSLLYKTTPIKFPTARYSGIKSIQIKVEILIELQMLFSIEL